MYVLYLVFDILFFSFIFVASLKETGLTETDSNNPTSHSRNKEYLVDSSSSSVEQKSTIINAPISIEILRIYVPFEPGNAVKLIWGKQIDDYPSNLTYGIHYGISEDDLKYPKLTTNESNALVEDLQYCTKYLFAVSVLKDSNSENKVNPNNIRSVVTQIDELETPKDLQVEYLPKEQPCLSIRWSASCPNTAKPVGYEISAFEKHTSRYVIVTLPRTTQADFIYNLKVNYDEKFNVKLSTTVPKSKTTETVTYTVPGFLQPYRVKITSNPDGAFMIYWTEPYVPYYIDRYYYQVNIYPGVNISTNVEKYYVTRPVIIYKGNESVYTFIVGFVSHDRQHRSLFTRPIVASLNGETRELGDEE